MSTILQKQASKFQTAYTDQADLLSDFSAFLNQYNLPYTPSGFYYLVNAITKSQGWILHISVVRSQLLDLLSVVVPELVTLSISFKIIRNLDAATKILEGSSGYVNLGKLISLYPESEAQAISIAERLIGLTSSFRGPAIPTDAHLGSIVYTRYGSFDQTNITPSGELHTKTITNKNGADIPDPLHIPFQLPGDISWPFDSITTLPIKTNSKLLHNTYYPIQVLKPDAKGKVIRALYFKNPLRIKSCIIKEGKHDMCSDDYGRDIVEKLKWQNQIYKELHTSVPLPEIYDYYEENGDAYLSMQWINGFSLQYWITNQYNNRSWFDLSSRSRLLILDTLIQVLSILQKVHGAGYIHRDLTPENILTDKKGKLWLIDMELSYDATNSVPSLLLQLGLPALCRPNRCSQKYQARKKIFTLLAHLCWSFYKSST